QRGLRHPGHGRGLLARPHLACLADGARGGAHGGGRGLLDPRQSPPQHHHAGLPCRSHQRVAGGELSERTMQTNFTPDQLKDPARSSSEKILRTCVHCGFCTATCPTYLLLGDELDSPRGRIYLMKDMLEAAKPATPEVVKHIDRCLSCLSCMTTCP